MRQPTVSKFIWWVWVTLVALTSLACKMLLLQQEDFSRQQAMLLLSKLFLMACLMPLKLLFA